MMMSNWTIMGAGAALAIGITAGCSDSSTADGTTSTGTATSSTSTGTGGAAAMAPDHKTLRAFVDNVVANQIIAKDPVVLSYFVPNTQAGASPTLDDIKECLATQVGAVLGNGDVYPPAAPLASGYVCRGDMAAIHQGKGGGTNENLGISDAVFMSFISDIVNEAHAESLPQSILDKLSPALLGLQTQVVDPASKDKGSVCYGGAAPGTDGKCAPPSGG